MYIRLYLPPLQVKTTLGSRNVRLFLALYLHVYSFFVFLFIYLFTYLYIYLTRGRLVAPGGCCLYLHQQVAISAPYCPLSGAMHESDWLHNSRRTSSVKINSSLKKHVAVSCCSTVTGPNVVGHQSIQFCCYKNQFS